MNVVDDDSMRTLYCILDRTNNYAFVQLALNWNYSEVFVPHFTVVNYGLHTKILHFNKLRVAFNNAYRRVLGLPWRSCPSAMYANFSIQNFEAVIRKFTFGFTQRLAKSTNSLIMAIESSLIVRIDIWDFWQKTLFQQNNFF